MGIRDALRQVFANPCQRLVNYDARVFQFSGLNVKTGPVDFSAGTFDSHLVRVEAAGSIVKMLDAYQFWVCTAAQTLKSKAKRDKYAELRINVAGQFLKLYGTLQAFRVDPRGQSKNLDNAIRVMQAFFDRVAVDHLHPPRRDFCRIGMSGTPMRIRTAKESFRRNQENVADTLVQTHRSVRAPQREFEILDERPIIDRVEKIRRLPLVAKGANRLTQKQLTSLTHRKAFSGALEFAGLKMSDVQALAEEISK